MSSPNLRRAARSGYSSRRACSSRTTRASTAAPFSTACSPGSAWAPPAWAKASPSPTGGSRASRRPPAPSCGSPRRCNSTPRTANRSACCSSFSYPSKPTSSTCNCFPNSPRCSASATSAKPFPAHRTAPPFTICLRTGGPMRQTSVAQLFEANRQRLQLTHLCGRLDALISVTEERIWPADLIGHLNLIHPARLQILGAAELAWAQRQSREKVGHHVKEIIDARPPALIVADGCPIHPVLRTICENADIALFTTPHPAASVIDQLRLYLSRELAEKTSLHGVF